MALGIPGAAGSEACSDDVEYSTRPPSQALQVQLHCGSAPIMPLAVSGQTKTSLLKLWNPRKFVWKELRDQAHELMGCLVVLGPIMTV